VTKLHILFDKTAILAEFLGLLAIEKIGDE